jgi:tetratricopeptide (TPR) repeat protein
VGRPQRGDEGDCRDQRGTGRLADEINLIKTQLGLLTKLRKYPDVVDITDKLVAKDKKLWWAYEARAVAKRYMGRKDDAINDFDAAIASASKAITTTRSMQS